MSNIIQIKTGTTPPVVGTLQTGELGCDLTNKKLYVGIGQDLDPVDLTDRIRFIKDIPTIGQLKAKELAFCLADKNMYIGIPEGDFPIEKRYLLTIRGGKGSTQVVQGVQVSISPTIPSGKVFLQWKVIKGIPPKEFNEKIENLSFTMPANDLTIEAIYGDPPPDKFEIQVINGKAYVNGKETTEAEKGQLVQIVADLPQSTMEFDYWKSQPDLPFNNASNATTTFIMPGNRVQIQALFKLKTNDDQYSITIIGGISSVNSAKEGEIITLTAQPAQGWNFIKWASEPEVIFSPNSTSETATFAMPSQNIHITAEVEEIKKTFQINTNNCVVKKENVVVTLAKEGEQLTVAANAPQVGYVFDKWTTVPEDLFNFYGDAGTFQMPNQELTITAWYKQTSDSQNVNFIKEIYDKITNNVNYKNTIVSWLPNGGISIEDPQVDLYRNPLVIYLSSIQPGEIYTLQVTGKSQTSNSLSFNFIHDGDDIIDRADTGKGLTGTVNTIQISSDGRKVQAIVLGGHWSPYKVEIHSLSINPPVSLQQTRILRNSIPRGRDPVRVQPYKFISEQINPYPVGSIYLTLADSSPEQLFGGKWVRLKGRFLYGYDETENKKIGWTGGEKEHQLTVDEMPSHSHTLERPCWYHEEIKEGERIYSYTKGATELVNDVKSIGSAGGGKAHNNMPPFLAVYMWQRIE